MDIKIPKFETTEIEIRETYKSADGRIMERTKKVYVPTGKIVGQPSPTDAPVGEAK